MQLLRIYNLYIKMEPIKEPISRGLHKVNILRSQQTELKPLEKSIRENDGIVNIWIHPCFEGYGNNANQLTLDGQSYAQARDLAITESFHSGNPAIFFIESMGNSAETYKYVEKFIDYLRSLGITDKSVYFVVTDYFGVTPRVNLPISSREEDDGFNSITYRNEEDAQYSWNMLIETLRNLGITGTVLQGQYIGRPEKHEKNCVDGLKDVLDNNGINAKIGEIVAPLH